MHNASLLSDTLYKSCSICCNILKVCLIILDIMHWMIKASKTGLTKSHLKPSQESKKKLFVKTVKFFRLLTFSKKVPS